MGAADFLFVKTVDAITVIAIVVVDVTVLLRKRLCPFPSAKRRALTLAWS